MISDSLLPNIPRVVTAVAEWSACIVLILSLKKRDSNKITLALIGLALIGQCLLQNTAQNLISSKIVFWYLGMLLNMTFMATYIYTIAKINWKNVIFICCKALLIAEFMASLAWQLFTQYLKMYGKENATVEVIIIAGIYCIILLTVFLLEKRDTTVLKKVNINWKQNVIAIILTFTTFVMSNLGYYEKDFFPIQKSNIICLL